MKTNLKITLLVFTCLAVSGAMEYSVQALPTESSSKSSPSEPKDTEKLPKDEWSQTLHQANQAYQQADYTRSASLYTRLIQSGLENGHIYYNLGNSLMRTGQLGNSITAYLRSARLLPRDQDVQTNLEYARKSIKDAVEPSQPSTLQKTLFFWHYRLSVKELFLLTGMVSLLFWTGMTVRIFRQESESLRWAVVGLLVLLTALGGSLAVRTLWPSEVVVVTEPVAKIHSATNRKTTVLFELHEGTEAELLDQDADWFKIRLSDGKRGWLTSDCAQVVR